MSIYFSTMAKADSMNLSPFVVLSINVKKLPFVTKNNILWTFSCQFILVSIEKERIIKITGIVRAERRTIHVFKPAKDNRCIG